MLTVLQIIQRLRGLGYLLGEFWKFQLMINWILGKKLIAKINRSWYLFGAVWEILSIPIVY